MTSQCKGGGLPGQYDVQEGDILEILGTSYTAPKYRMFIRYPRIEFPYSRHLKAFPGTISSGNRWKTSVVFRLCENTGAVQLCFQINWLKNENGVKMLTFLFCIFEVTLFKVI